MNLVARPLDYWWLCAGAVLIAVSAVRPGDVVANEETKTAAQALTRDVDQYQRGSPQLAPSGTGRAYRRESAPNRDRGEGRSVRAD